VPFSPLSDRSDTMSVGRRIRREIDGLLEEHADALEDAVYLGMTREQLREYDEPRKKITELIEKLRLLECSQVQDS
jgi:hypothetical protein